MAWNIFCDFDGTIALDDVTDTLLERFAAPAWHDIELDWQAGLIGSRECMARQVDLLNMSRAELDLHLDGIAVDPDFVSFVAEARAEGHVPSIVSDGLDYSIRRILARIGLEDLAVVANSLEQTGERSWKLGFPNFQGSCQVASGTCKCATVERAAPERGVSGRSRGTGLSLLIGDGTSDFCAAQSVDFVFAKHKLIGHCRERDLPHAGITGFGDARSLLGMLDRIRPFDMPVPAGSMSTPESR